LRLRRVALFAFLVNFYFVYQLLRTLSDGNYGRDLASWVLSELGFLAFVGGLLLFLRWRWR